MNKIHNKQNRNRVTDTKNRLTAVGMEAVWELGGKGEGIKRNKTLIDTDNSMTNTRGKGAWEK